ncbi:MAG: dienelactone hydrolase family protein [Nostoc sp. LLA-1]|nr:dienelactone hydrolase family protein [Cyanocohniella sp. LLY]
MNHKPLFNINKQIVTLELGNARLKGELVIPDTAKGIILFAHGTEISRDSTRNHNLAHLMRQEGRLATILIDLLTPEEEAIDQRTKHFHCDIRFLATRLVAVTDWLLQSPITHHLNIGYFGTDTGGGAAFLAATIRPLAIKAIVARSGQTDLVSEALSDIQTPTLLIVGGNDLPIIAMNEDAIAQMPAKNKKLEIIPGATHQFGEPGALEEVARLASQWFQHYLTSLETRDIHLHDMHLE